ncbi:MAG TPA: ATP-binding protein [Candidatus Sulfotelmatobacter sp.]|nr:ATP-binding protein [Candidatus Sulfotelmatobacter sp.]
MEIGTPERTSTAPVKLALVVDADPVVTCVLRTVLKPDEWEIVYAADNQAIWKLIKTADLDLIITGAKTTGREDVDLLRKIRLVRPHIRFIILTDQSTPADVVTAMREGAFSYFSKPFSTASLAAMVRIATLEPTWDDGIELVSATPEWISIIARCDHRTADRLVQFFEEMSDLPAPEKEDVAAAFREMLLNAIEHGGKFDPSQYVEVAYVRTRKMVLCRIKDPGQGFSLGEIHHAAINNPSYDPIRHVLFREAQGLRPGGYGVLMTRHLVDELVYSENGNEVLLVKYLPPDQLTI